MLPVIRLCEGIGVEGHSHCVMAATSIVAGESFSDRPTCVSPVITSLLRSVNDSFPAGEDGDRQREQTLGHLPWLIIGTRGSMQHEAQRSQIAARFATRCAVYALCVTGRRDLAKQLRRGDITATAAWHAAIDAVGATNERRAAAAAAAARHAADAAWSSVNAARESAWCAWYAARRAAAASPRSEQARQMFRRRIVRMVETELIPIYTTMTVEPGHRIDQLITADS